MTQSHQRWIATARLLTSILIVVGLADAVSRGFSVKNLAFRGWEAMTFHRPQGFAFEPLATYEGRSYGDLANIGNLPDQRMYRHTRWTTDAYGFRNPTALASSGKVAAILLGDSYAAGSGVSDDETLAAQLTTRGLTTYNAAPMLMTAADIAAFAGKLGISGGVILHQHSSGLRFGYVKESGIHATTFETHPPLTYFDRIRLGRQMPTWPLRIMAERFVKSWQDDRWLPNPFKSAVEVRRLVNGDTMMFFANESVEAGLNPVQQQAINETVAYYRGIADGLRSGPFRFAVVLVPERISLYAHLLTGSIWKGGPSGYLQELDRSLRAAGIATINLYPALAARADEAWPRFEYVVWRDDTHWNSRGIAAAADEIVASLPDVGEPPTEGVQQ